MKKVYVVAQWSQDASLYTEQYATKDEALARLEQLVNKYDGHLELFNDLDIDHIAYDDVEKDYSPLRLHPHWMPETYDITDADVGALVAREPDTVDMDTLAMGDKIGRWVDASISFSVSVSPQESNTELPQIVPLNLTGDVYTFDNPPRYNPFDETILICYVASIQPDKKFKVYAAWGDRNDIQQTANRGRKVRDEAFAKQLFPMLEDYEFVVN